MTSANANWNGIAFLTDPKARPAYSIILVGAMGSGKTLAGCCFPKIYYLGTDPTGLDTLLYQESTAPLVKNLVAGEVLNGYPLDEVFAEEGEHSFAEHIRTAVAMARENRIRTIFIDNLTYLFWMYWQFIDGDNNTNTQQSFGQLSRFANSVLLENVLPLTVRENINVVMAVHVQREREEAVKGATAFAPNMIRDKDKEKLARSKRAVNINSDISPAILGSTRSIIGGMPSAMIWLRKEAGEATETSKGQPTLKYFAHTTTQYVPAWETEIEAKNRYDLPPIINLTGGSLYGTLLARTKAAREARPEVKAMKATAGTPPAATSSEGSSGPSTALDGQPSTTINVKENVDNGK